MMINGVARHHRERERHALLATGDGENQRVQFVDDITGKDLPWSEVRQAREHELKHLRDFGVFEKVDEREAIEKYQIPPVDTNGIDTHQASEMEQIQIRSRLVARELNS